MGTNTCDRTSQNIEDADKETPEEQNSDIGGMNNVPKSLISQHSLNLGILVSKIIDLLSNNLHLSAVLPFLEQHWEYNKQPVQLSGYLLM